MTAKPEIPDSHFVVAAHRAVSAHEAVEDIARAGAFDAERLHLALDARQDAIVALGRSVLNILLSGGELTLPTEHQSGDPRVTGSAPRVPLDPVAETSAAVMSAVQSSAAPVVLRKRSSAPSRRRALGATVAHSASAEPNRRLPAEGLGPNWSHAETENTPESWRAAVEAFGPPPEVPDIVSYDRALQRLVHGVQVDEWRNYPRSLQRSLVGYASSIARFLQDEAGPIIGLSHPPHELSTMFSVMTRYSDVERPGFVSGLSRRNPPEHGTWALDCAWWWARLQRLVGEEDGDEPVPAADKTKAWADLRSVLDDGADAHQLIAALRGLRTAGVSNDDKELLDAVFPHAHLLEGVTAFKTLRKKLKRMAEDEEEVVEAEDESAPLPDDWPVLEHTRGKIAAVLGGEPRPRALARLKAAFEFSDLTWEVADGRRTQALADRVSEQGLDMVIVLRRFVSHKLTDVLLPACRSAEVHFVVVDSGYGVNQTRMALERYLG